VDGPVCITGDAAHSTTPFQGSGAGISIEDSLILSTLLGRATSASEAEVALKVYNRVRRPRTQRVVQSSRETAWLFTRQEGLNAKETKKRLAHRWDFILDLDVVKHRDEALRMMEEELVA
jgi:salicylate hydroxylase